MNIKQVTFGVVIVTFHPNIEELRKIIAGVVSEFAAQNANYQIYVWDNSSTDNKNILKLVLPSYVKIMTDGTNRGYGGAINKVLMQTAMDWYLVLNQDVSIKSGSISKAIDAVRIADSQDAVFELSHRPCEHPKVYDPVSKETPWFSGAAFFIAKIAFSEAGGFDENLFMYGEDVDIAFKMRHLNYKIRYLPDCVVYHNDVNGANKQKPVQEVYDRANNILLRLRYGSMIVVMSGFAWLLIEYLYLYIIIGRKLPIGAILKQIGKNVHKFLFNRVYNVGQRPLMRFNKWTYCRHRIGGDYIIEPVNGDAKVSVIIRTCNRPQLLVEAITTVVNQTYKYIEIVVVDDGEGQGRQVVEAYSQKSNIEFLYVKTDGKCGRAKAGNVGLHRCSGDYICFLDEDDQLYADHIEALLSCIKNKSLKIAYSLSEEVVSEKMNESEWQDGKVCVRYKNDFSRVLLWYKNYIPIQSVLFARELYEKYGGFDDELDLYEDWSLWVKYSTTESFGFVGKSTSRYRIAPGRRKRSKVFEGAYVSVIERHNYKYFVVSPVEFRCMVREYLRYRGILCVTKEHLMQVRKMLFFIERSEK